MNKFIASFLIISVLAPTSFAYAGWFDVFKSAAGLVQGFSGVPGLYGNNAINSGRVPIFDQATEEIKKKEVGTKRINIPGAGSVGLPIPGVSGSLDGIAWQLSRMAINKITKDVVNWIRGGGRDGKPLFITNWEDFLKDVVNEASGIFIQDLELTEICQPFKPRLQLLMGIGRAPYYQRAQCTIKDVARNVENFYRDFKQGGWERWFEITMVPQNNFYGAYYLALEEKLIRESSALEAKQSEAIAGGGFLGAEICADQRGDICVNWQITSPGTLIQDQLEEVFGSDIRQLELADEIDEIIGAAFQRLFTELRGKSPNGILSAQNQAKDPINIFGKAAEAEVGQAKQQVSNILELPQAISLSEQIPSIKQDSISKVNSLIGVLEALNSCQESGDESKINTQNNNKIQLQKDIKNITMVTAQLTEGEAQLAKAKSTDEVYQLFADLKAAVDIVISLYDSAVAENNQVSADIQLTQNQLDACSNSTTNE